MEVLVRCTHCMYVCKQWEHPTEIVFIPSTLMKYAEMACEQCSQVGMEIYVGEPVPEGPVLFLPLDEESGTVARDLSGHGHEASLRRERE